jgi:hypothetical protein
LAADAVECVDNVARQADYPCFECGKESNGSGADDQYVGA